MRFLTHTEVRSAKAVSEVSSDFRLDTCVIHRSRLPRDTAIRTGYFQTHWKLSEMRASLSSEPLCLKYGNWRRNRGSPRLGVIKFMLVSNFGDCAEPQALDRRLVALHVAMKDLSVAIAFA